jgi:predicted AlkP superfamily phosphohydrolase/phosphomutase
MKILLVELNGADPELLFQDEHLENIRRLMALGCYGLLQNLSSSDLPPDRIAEVVAEAGKPFVVMAAPPNATSIPAGYEALFAASQAQFELAREALQAQDWEYFRVVEPALESLHHTPNIDQASISAFYQGLDGQIGSILELLSEDTLLVLLSSRGVLHPEGCFIVAAPNNPVRGELQNLNLLDIAPTVLQLAGYELPPGLPGKSLVADLALDEFSSTELTEEEEAILRERLSGLGYI